MLHLPLKFLQGLSGAVVLRRSEISIFQELYDVDVDLEEVLVSVESFEVHFCVVVRVIG